MEPFINNVLLFTLNDHIYTQITKLIFNSTLNYLIKPIKVPSHYLHEIWYSCFKLALKYKVIIDLWDNVQKY